jgi:valyl-tRNA synthetase/inosine/xanthosine triphosphate pyrophosphatase family protein
MSLAPTYNSKDFEDKIYQKWQSAGVGTPENQNLANSKPKVLFATTNRHKIRLFKLAWEYQSLDQKYELLTLKDFDTIALPEVVEDSGTFEGDALLKASAYTKFFNIPTISQDRGFELDALDGWPGTDSKKVMFGSDQIIHTSKEHWESLRDENTARALDVLEKIQGKSRSMRVVQGLAIALPDGTFVAEKFETLGQASKKIVTKFGGSFDWFFVPDGLGHILAEFETQDELEIYQSKNMYPITNKITDFLDQKLHSETYSILMPPPNLTGDLHAGHAFQHYIMDTLTRIHRQKGQPSLWYPGVDHAGIQLEGVIDKLIKMGEFDEVLTQKYPHILDIPTSDRPKWLKNTDRDLWTQLAWSKVNTWRDNQKKQSSVLGDTPDYERSLFTLDDRANNMVNFAFQKYWQDGLIYKGSYLINWSVGLQTAVSDVAGEIEYEKRVDPFVTFEYKVEIPDNPIQFNNNSSEEQREHVYETLQKVKNYLKNNPLFVSTVRPETIFGDFAIGIHSNKLKQILKNINLSKEDEDLFFEGIENKRIHFTFGIPELNVNYIHLIVEDELIDENFGTGVLKITPASDLTDYQIFKKHYTRFNLSASNLMALQNLQNGLKHSIGRDGKLTDICGDFAGLTVEQGRLAVIKILAQTGYVPLKPEFLLDTDIVRKEIESKKLELLHFDPTDYSYTEGQKRLREILGEAGEKLQIDWKYEHNVTLCERSKTVIEPLISEEFFLSYHDPKNNLQQIGLKAVEETNFYPADLKDRAQNFLENIKDWCISRDLVWGHKMPIWYNLELNPNKVFYSFEQLNNNVKIETNVKLYEDRMKAYDLNIEEAPHSGFDDSKAERRYLVKAEVEKMMQISSEKPTTPGNWVQEEKILDTWFSSCLWPLSTLDYYDFVQGKSGTDFENYYSTTDMISGADIFYQWIIRMMMVCKYFTDKTPYKNIILNPTVRDEQGRKMSKSLGNGLDAVNQIDKFSSDSLRLAMLSGMIPNRNFRLGGKIADKMCEKYRNFGNKLWNVARFLESKEASL